MPEPAPGVRVAILADDLIWAERLAAAVRAAGAAPVRVRDAARLSDALAASGGSALTAVIVDLTARAYDGIAAVGAATAAGMRVLAVGQHDDAPLRRRARAAGAERVLAYRALHDRGAELVVAWLSAVRA